MSKTWRIVLGAALLLLLCWGVFAWTVERIGVAPRLLGPYLERRASGHNALIVGIGTTSARVLTWLDRGLPMHWMPPLLKLGAQPQGQPDPEHATVHAIASSAELRQALAQARAGDSITLLPGVYRFSGKLDANRPGTEQAPIRVRALQPGSVRLEFDMTEGFLVSAPWWIFENLHIRGICREHSTCEHAFHVVGNAHHFVARNNVISDFNAHFKINAHANQAPDHGLLENNTLRNTTARHTHHPVVPIDLVGASHWRVHANFIHDFVKRDGDQISYGGYFKGAGSDNRFERNVVLCELALRGFPGQRVGLSLGGGGTGQEFCRDKRCITEQDDSRIDSNLIGFCSDDGIYINRAATSQIRQNTLIDTGGISVRFPESSADVVGNLIDGAIRSRDEGLIRQNGNLSTTLRQLYLGQHPVRSLFQDIKNFNLAWEGTPPRWGGDDASSLDSGLDLCGQERPPQPIIGAFESFTPCLR